MLMILLILTICSAATVKQFIPKPKTDIKGDTIYLKEDGYLTDCMDYLKVVKREPWSGKKPKVWKLDNPQYPHYGSDQIYTLKDKQGIIDENTAYMRLIAEHAYNGTLRRMPEDVGGDKQFEAPEVNYEAERITVDYTVNPKNIDYRAVGWAFPGEVVTIELPKDMELNGLSVAIGKMNRKAVDTYLNTNNWANVRMPIDTYEFVLTDIADLIEDNVVKIGSPLGGMVYFKIGDNWYKKDPFTIKVSNIGQAPIYLFGQTTQEDHENELKNAPGNVVSILTPGVRLEFVKSRLPSDFQPLEIMKWWYTVHSTADQVIDIPNRPIVMFYDQRVDAGAAVAFVGAFFTQHQSDWATGATDIKGLLREGQWGSLHEFHHHKQSVRGGVDWGIDPTGESTNNLLTALDYIEYTNIQGNRHNGLTGWNWVTDGFTTMKAVFKGENREQAPLQFYVSTIHGFGSAKMLETMSGFNTYKTYIQDTLKLNLKSSASYTYIASTVTKYDMRYLCKKLGFTDCNAIDNEIGSKNYPVYYPFYNKYCMTYNGNRYGRSYKIQYGEKIILNMTDTTAIDSAATNVQITFTKNPAGKLTKVQDNIYEYTPEGKVGTPIPFSIQIKCKVDGKDVTVKQDGEFDLIAGFFKTKKFFNPKSEVISELKELYKDAEPDEYHIETELRTHYFNQGTERRLYMTGKGKLKIENKGYYTFFVRGKDRGEWVLNKGGNTIVNLTFNKETSDYSTSEESLYKTIYLDEGIYEHEMWNWNWWWNAYCAIAYCYHGISESNADANSCKPVVIPSSMILCEGAPDDSKEKEFVLPTIKYWRKGQYLTHSYRTIPLCQTRDDANCPINCTDIPKDEPVEKSACSNIFDMQSSIYHTSYNTATKFPATFEFAFPKKFSFNYYYLHHRNYRDSFGNYTMYGKTGSKEYEFIHNVTNTQGNIEQFNFDKTYEYDHIKFVVYNNIENNNFVVIQDLYFGMGTEAFGNYSKPWGDNVERIAGMEKVIEVGAYGNYLVQNTKAGSGEFCFNFKGKRFGLYGHRKDTSGEGKVTFDNQEQHFDMSYPMDSTGTLFYYYIFSNNGDHKVCVSVTKGIVNFDLIGFD